MMPDGMIDIMTSLAAIMNEESELLQGRERTPSLPELAAAKARLVGQLEEALARRNRLEPDWMDSLEEEAKTELKDCLRNLQDASARNSDVLERQMELTADLLSAITKEARRIAGNRTFTYGAEGHLAKAETPTPISFNSEY
jgi:flagellar biosynthesis/type III secretory pathway chaperone